MVTSATSLGRSGVSDWLVQRVSALVLLAYLLFLAAYVAGSEVITWEQWRGLFGQTWMKVFSLAALLALCAHAWIGMWTVATDYLTERMLGSAGTAVRLLFQLGCLAILFAYFVWCIQILWSI